MPYAPSGNNVNKEIDRQADRQAGKQADVNIL
jgi:hypothetical protein